MPNVSRFWRKLLPQRKKPLKKVSLAAELAAIVNKDIGGIFFMSSDLHNTVGPSGLMPGTAAVLSMAVPGSYMREWKLPFVTDPDMKSAGAVLCPAVALLAERSDLP